MTRVRRWVTAAVLGGAVLPLSACNRYGSGATGNLNAAPEKPPVEIGADLYKREPMPQLPKVSPAPEPIVIPNAIVQNDLRVQIAAQVDGKVEMIATPLQPNEKCEPELVVYHPRDPEKRPYRRLRQGELIREGQLIARLDEQLVTLQREQAEKALPLMRERVKANKSSEDDFRQSYDLLEKTSLNALSLAEKLEKRSTLYRYIESRLQAEQELTKTESELRAAMAQQRRYFVESPINGRIIRLLKSRDEFAKAGDPIMEVQATDRIRVEGKLDAAYRNLVRPGMRVTVEPARPVSPNPLTVSHRQEVTGLAVTAHPGRPMVVSGGLDASVLVWDLTNTKQYFRLPLPAGVAVRSVACTGKGSKTHLIAAGGDDGRVRVWDISNPDKMPAQPLATFEEAHAAAVTAVGFSPDGKHLATAAGRDVYVWDVATRKRKYALPADDNHKDTVTAVRFTPQCTLVTAARDHSVRVWKLGEQGAASSAVIDHRGGSVDLLGVSADGSKVLFDKEPGRLDVVSLADERTVGALSTPGGSARCATLALFSPDDTFILTAGGDADQKGELTIWEAPQPGGRGAERLRLTTPRAAAVTCAAFSPDPEKRFVVVGTADGSVHYWTPSLVDQRGKAITAEVVSVLPHDARQVLVGVELANPSAVGDDLPDRSQATIIISPDGAPQAAMPATVRPAAATGAEGGGVIPAGGIVVPAAGPGAALPAASPTGGLTIPPAGLPGKK